MHVAGQHDGAAAFPQTLPDVLDTLVSRYPGKNALEAPGGAAPITERIREIIIRGGEKISPGEVDEVLLAHPAVAQVMTFGVPHAALGEAVAAAVVLRPQADASESELVEFAASRLVSFKVP
jgi:acyl-CoA synthetase (AMP-forming)/AMP-acid ligase II